MPRVDLENRSSSVPVVSRMKAPARMQTRKLRAPLDKTIQGGWFVGDGANERAPSMLSLVRARARDLVDNNPYAARAVGVLTSHVVGRGIRLAISGDAEYRAAFDAWARSQDADFEGRLSFFGLQSILARTMFAAGDCLLVMHRTKIDGEIKLQLQLIDSDQLNDMAKAQSPGNKCHGGVEVDAAGRIVGYHIIDDRGGTQMRGESVFIPAKNVMHALEVLYPGQVRGIPRGAQALVRSKTVDDFMTAALAKARTEACFSVFLSTPGDEADNMPLMGEEGEIDDPSDMIPETLSPGAVVTLPPGYDAKIATPSGSGGLADYVRIALESIAVAYGVTYSQISGDLSRVNYSSEKAGRVEFFRSVESVREHHIIPLLLRTELAFREIYELQTGRSVNVSVTAVPPAREPMEPLKEANAAMIALSAGGMTWSQYCLERGHNPDDQLAAIAEERKRLKDLGIQLTFKTALELDPAAQDAQGGQGGGQDSNSGDG